MQSSLLLCVSCPSAERSATRHPLWNPGRWSRECARGRRERGTPRAGHWSFARWDPHRCHSRVFGQGNRMTVSKCTKLTRVQSCMCAKREKATQPRCPRQLQGKDEAERGRNGFGHLSTNICPLQIHQVGMFHFVFQCRSESSASNVWNGEYPDVAHLTLRALVIEQVPGGRKSQMHYVITHIVLSVPLA